MNRVFSFLALLAVQTASLADETNKAFSFVALGDTAYSEERYPEYESLIGTINQSDAEFSIHVGDTIGYQPCNDESDKQVSYFFEQFQRPVVYTPGDNEWRDCYIESEDSEEKSMDDHFSFRLDRLDTLRRLYFSEAKSLGQTKMPVIRQSDVSEYSDMVENAYWIHNGVLFATLHIVGSANGMSAWSEATSLESIRRTKANGDWIEMLTTIAADNDVQAIVLAMHTGLLDGNRPPFGEMSTMIGSDVRNGFFSTYSHAVFALLPLFSSFEKPILIIHGDFHKFIVDRPFLAYNSEEDPDANPNKHVVRLQVFGAPELKAVKVSVNPDAPWVFGFTPLY